ncbi:MAG: hypothetical protein IPI46_03415 [Bacteroidetes bacterium]|nr:hypothetical protein [Bacteroidota bacterium]
MKESIRYYKHYVIIPSIISLIGAIFCIILSNRNYKSEWFSANSVIVMLVVSALIYCMMLCSFCIPILLLNKRRVTNNKLLQLVCWFLFPVGFIITVSIHENISRMIMEFGLNEQVIIFFILNIPILLGLICGYLTYMKRNKNSLITNSNHDKN